MFNRILVPLDGSPFAERALGPALAVAHQHHAHITLVQVVERPPIVPDPFGVAVSVNNIQQLRFEAEAVAHAYLSGIAEQLTVCGVANVQTRVEYGSTGQWIASIAGEGNDLVVMSTHGRSGLRRALLGSVAAQVIQQTILPVLLVSSQQPVADFRRCEFSFSHVLVPLDGSALSEQALPFAAAMVGDGGSILLLKVVGALEDTSSYVAHELGSAQAADYSYTLPDRRDLEADRYLTEAIDRHLPPTLACERIEGSGDPADAILIASQVEGCDLIVMATHARHGLARLLHGSVTEQVVSRSSVPVMVLRGQAAAPAEQPFAPTVTTMQPTVG